MSDAKVSEDGVKRRFAPAAARNRAPILAVLRRVLSASARVLEVGSGTGEHAVFFARSLPHLQWQPSDADPEALASIAAWRAHEALPNVLPALRLDVRERPWPVGPVDAVFSANLLHIAPWEAGVALIGGAGRCLAPGGRLILYGPFRLGGTHTAPSNDAFDQSLRARDPRWGVRDLEAVADEAAAGGLTLVERVAMPANNLTVVFERDGARGGER